MKNFEFTKEQVEMLAKCVEYKQGVLRQMNDLYREAKPLFVQANEEQIARLQTLLNYLQS